MQLQVFYQAYCHAALAPGLARWGASPTKKGEMATLKDNSVGFDRDVRPDQGAAQGLVMTILNRSGLGAIQPAFAAWVGHLRALHSVCLLSHMMILPMCFSQAGHLVTTPAPSAVRPGS